MKPVHSIASLAVILTALAACAGETAKSTPAPAATPAAAAAPAAKHEMKKVAASANYPLKTCVVSGEELPAVGDRVAYTCDGTEVQFCCPDCVATFEKNPAPYLAKIAAGK